MGRRRVRPLVEQGVLPGFETVAREPTPRRPRGVDPALGVDWEEAAFREGCAHGRELALARLGALEAALHEARPATLAVVGWRTRTVVTRLGEIRVRRRLYRDTGGGGAVFLLDPHLGWTPERTATPAFLALLVDWAADVPVAEAARRMGAATAGVLSGPTVLRQVRAVAGRIPGADLDDETWRRAQQRIASHHKVPHQVSGDYLLTGLLRCPACRGRMHGNARCVGYSRRDRCQSYAKGASVTQCFVTVHAPSLERFVLARLGALVERLAALPALQESLRDA